jgi:hypothetical protein
MRAMFERLRTREQTRTPQANAVPGLDRRNFLRGAAATAGLSALSLDSRLNLAEASPRLSARERGALLDKSIREMSDLARSDDVRRALRGEGNRILSRILRPLQFPVAQSKLAEFVRGTSYDVADEQRRHCVQYRLRRVSNGTAHYSVTAGRNGMPPLARFGDNTYGYGNGFFYGGPRDLMSAHHVIHAARENIQHFPGGIDLQAVRLTEEDSAHRLGVEVVPEHTFSNEHIHGSFVTVVGFDSGDPTADDPGGEYKRYRSIAIRLEKATIEKIFPHVSSITAQCMSNSFMYALPPGEAQDIGGGKIYAHGTSGSPVWMHRDGKKFLAGVNWGAMQLQDHENYRTLDVGFFHGIDEVREHRRNPNVAQR